jgi:diketogulonate reductase-like aldo/keto reductase
MSERDKVDFGLKRKSMQIMDKKGPWHLSAKNPKEEFEESLPRVPEHQQDYYIVHDGQISTDREIKTLMFFDVRPPLVTFGA